MAATVEQLLETYVIRQKMAREGVTNPSAEVIRQSDLLIAALQQCQPKDIVEFVSSEKGERHFLVHGRVIASFNLDFYSDSAR